MTYTKRDFEKIMKNNGYILDRNRGKGSHIAYTRGSRTITIGRSYNKAVIQRLIKENNLAI